ncbi:MAG TPA: NDP-sugar synthase [Baekduia sp.]|nr:NDP-sugar synthase [Baekduia sp.]
MQAVILVGGEGTRLRPLTSLRPKPIITLVDRPFLVYMLEWLRGHGVDDVILSCGFLPTQIEAELGDGSALGITLRYAVEPEPRGTAGALKFCEELLDERFLMLNGDVLTDVDISAQLAQHQASGATGTLGLVPVEDPSAYGLVLLNEDRSVAGFLEKPAPEQLEGVDEYLISAGIYVLEREITDLIEPDQKVSIEHVIWPQLAEAGTLFGYAAREAYWMDIGTPDRYLQGSFDILTGAVTTDVTTTIGSSNVLEPSLVDETALIAADAVVGPLAVVGPGVRVAQGARIERAVVLEGAHIGADAVINDSVVAPGASIGAGSTIRGQTIVGENATVGAGHHLADAAKIDPGAELPDREMI